MTTDLLQRGKHIKLAIFDVDGVLTDGRLISQNGIPPGSTPTVRKS